MSENILRLRPHHLNNFYHYFIDEIINESGFFRNRVSLNALGYGEIYIDKVIDLTKKFWNGHFSKLEVVSAEDDFCRSCRFKRCRGRNAPDDYQQINEVRFFSLNLGVYDSDEVKRAIKEKIRNTFQEVIKEKDLRRQLC